MELQDDTKSSIHLDLFASGKVVASRREASPDFPFIVALKTPNGHWFSGTLIGPRHVLTAAFWLESRLESDISRMKILTGNFDVGKTFRSKQTRISDIIIHPNRDYMSNDLAVIELEDMIPETSNIEYVKLGGQEDETSISQYSSSLMCWHDIGGAIVYKKGSSWIQIGLLGVEDVNKFWEPISYTRISIYREWIASVTHRVPVASFPIISPYPVDKNPFYTPSKRRRSCSSPLPRFNRDASSPKSPISTSPQESPQKASSRKVQWLNEWKRSFYGKENVSP